MPAHLPGFEYDIFISYRHNDNKGPAGQPNEGWVSEFVRNLKDELEATVKGGVIIYFDKNPHDGLLETHQVEDSLSEKLKSLIFIPVVSQTYCDPESYAWTKEFQPFIRIAAEDKYGLSIKLPGGNVSSRILPIRIHELDVADVKLLETELNGKLRSVDFVFKSPGVNRPLRAREEDPLKNANHTIYRDQINKTANAIKEILNGMKNAGGAPVKVPEQRSNIISSPAPSKGLKTIAVLSFKTTDATDAYLGNGLADEIFKLLSRVRDIKVIDRANSNNFRNSRVSLIDIAQKLGAGSVLDGNIQRSNDQLHLTLSLHNASGSSLWTETFIQKTESFFDQLPKFALTVAHKLDAVIRDGEKVGILKTPTQHGGAYDQYLKGKFLLNAQDDLPNCLSCFNKAIALDPKFSFAYAGIAQAYVLLGYYKLITFSEAIEKAKVAAFKALEIDPTLLEAYLVLAFISMGYEWNWPEAEPNFSKLFTLNPNNPTARDRFDLYLKQISGNIREAESDPIITVPHFLKAYALLHHGKFEEALQSSQKAVDTEPDSFMANRALGLSYLGMEKYEQAIESLLTASRLSNRHHWLLFELMGAYMLSGRMDEARAILEEALAHSNALPAKVFNFLFSGRG